MGAGAGAKKDGRTMLREYSCRTRMKDSHRCASVGLRGGAAFGFGLVDGVRSTGREERDEDEMGRQLCAVIGMMQRRGKEAGEEECIRTGSWVYSETRPAFGTTHGNQRQPAST